MKDRLPDFCRSAQDCRTRIKRVNTKYFETKRANNKSGGKRKTFPYYDRLDNLLGTRPSVNLLALTDTLNDDPESDNETGGENLAGMCNCLVIWSINRAAHVYL